MAANRVRRTEPHRDEVGLRHPNVLSASRFDIPTDDVYKSVMSKRKTNCGMADVLRDAVRDSGLSNYRIAKDTGIVDGALLRFMSGETSMRLDKAELLAEYLGLELTKKTQQKQ
jgi:ribosome-binding protein aMBF1 (putative translation factor)